METNRAILFVNGDLENTQFLKSFVKPNDYLIAVDGGLQHVMAAGLLPDILIGDLDSVTEEDLQIIQKKNIPVHQLNVRKDETDLEIAIQYTVDKGFKEIILLAAVGDRIDHTIANINILTRPEWQKEHFSIQDDRQEVFFIGDKREIHGFRGDLVSLLSISERVTGVMTKGLEYPLSDENLYRYKARGISNKMTSSLAEISLLSGLLLCVHFFSKQNAGEESRK